MNILKRKRLAVILACLLPFAVLLFPYKEQRILVMPAICIREANEIEGYNNYTNLLINIINYYKVRESCKKFWIKSKPCVDNCLSRLKDDPYYSSFKDGSIKDKEEVCKMSCAF